MERVLPPPPPPPRRGGGEDTDDEHVDKTVLALIGAVLALFGLEVTKVFDTEHDGVEEEELDTVLWPKQF